jgi:predicted MPP superfamily phosphohydrolase
MPPLFFIIVLSVWAGLHVYVAFRLASPLPIRRSFRIALGLFFLPSFLLAPLAFYGKGVIGWPYDITLVWLAWIEAGAFSMLLAFIVLRDLALLVLRLASRLLEARGSSLRLLPDAPERRQFLRNVTGGAAVGATSVLTGVGIRAARRLPEVTHVEVPIEGLPKELDGYHIVQLSDIHVGMTIDKDFILPIVEAVTTLAPDLIALTGDIVDGSVDSLRDDVSPLGYLRAPDGVLCVTGNHEYYSGVDEWTQHFRELGISMLTNQHVSIARGNAKLVVAGIPDHREGKRHPGHTPDASKALAGAPQHDVRILLAHQPKAAFVRENQGFALQLSGHTHGGQYFPFNLFIGLFEPLPTGMSRVQNTWVYVSRGTCYWGPPLRTGVPPEITSLRLKRA